MTGAWTSPRQPRPRSGSRTHSLIAAMWTRCVDGKVQPRLAAGHTRARTIGSAGAVGTMATIGGEVRSPAAKIRLPWEKAGSRGRTGGAGVRTLTRGSRRRAEGDRVNDKEFYRSVAQRAGLSRGEAADLTRATLETVADRVSGGEARDLAAELPEPLAQPSVSGHRLGPEGALAGHAKCRDLERAGHGLADGRGACASPHCARGRSVPAPGPFARPRRTTERDGHPWIRGRAP